MAARTRSSFSKSAWTLSVGGGGSDTFMASTSTTSCSNVALGTCTFFEVFDAGVL
jgi:hypothetical protein